VFAEGAEDVVGLDGAVPAGQGLPAGVDLVEELAGQGPRTVGQQVVHIVLDVGLPFGWQSVDLPYERLVGHPISASIVQRIGHTFSLTIPASDGSFTISATARDDAGNLDSTSTTITVDSARRVIVLTSPPENHGTNATSLTDVSPVTLRVDGALVPVSGGAFSAPVSLGAEGLQAIVFEATGPRPT
jgi:hypothetical protein